MIIYFAIYAIFILAIFNSLTSNFCLKMKLNAAKQTRVFRMINIMIVILLVTSYVRVINVIG